MAVKAQNLEVEGRTIPVTNLEKVLYPKTEFTKGQVIDYYIRISKYLLPHLKDRPVTLKRFPDGVRGDSFYEKNAPSYTPGWVQRFAVPSPTRGSDIHYILINDLPTLVWLANAANLEVHPFLHRVPRIQRPTAMVFDLDPGEGSDVLTCAKLALLIREVFTKLRLECFVKVSGSKGLQLYVPLNTDIAYTATKAFAGSLAGSLEKRHPDLVVSRMSKHLRSGKVFIDWSQNDEHKTTVSVYSLRAKADEPFVSTPITWEELEQAISIKKPDKLYFTPEEVLQRVEKLDDLFAPLLRLKQRLPESIDPLPEPVSSTRPRKSTSSQREKEPLEIYRKKRDFLKTPEPGPSVPERAGSGKSEKFVIQKHEASHLHYDFRLEMDGVLKSWAVPKGPPFEKGMKRLAMATEDHPLGYLDFEGIIPKGQYGGGTVMVWDIGSYKLTKDTYRDGTLHFVLAGKKLKGEWVLARSHQQSAKMWFLIKAGASMPALSPEHEDESALSGRTMAQIAQAKDAEWQSKSKPKIKRRGAAIEQIAKQPPQRLNLSKLPSSTLTFSEPMLAKLVQEVPEGNEWNYEIKLDGFRALAIKKRGRLTLYSRRGNQLTSQFPALASALKQLEDGTTLDGEIVALDKQGRPSFNALQNRRGGELPVFFYAFDLLAYRGKDARELPLSERRTILEHFALQGLNDPIRISPSFSASGSEVVDAARKQNLEGVVAKRTDSTYESGLRSGAWVKYKTMNGQELVVGGYIPGSHGFDSLLTGYYDHGKLMFLAKVRNGFVPALRREVAKRFRGLETDACPFTNLPEPKSVRQGKALTKEFMKECRWLKPKLVAQVEFADWTEANNLRHARFVGLRGDKDARKVIREIAA